MGILEIFGIFAIMGCVWDIHNSQAFEDKKDVHFSILFSNPK